MNFGDKVSPGKYLVAVSGGVDSVALLNYLKDLPDLDLIVAHVNHGIRPDNLSDKDENLVRSLCKKWNIELEVIKLDLGPNSSEDLARQKRHDFLRKVQKKHKCLKIVTAHHRDDVIETMVINLLRGTGRKGLSSLKNDEIFLRPFLGLSKNQIKEYASNNNLQWLEDQTNADTKYLRNYIRLVLMPKILAADKNFKSKFLQVYSEMIVLNPQIDSELTVLEASLRHSKDMYDKKAMIMLPIEVSYSFLHFLLTQIYKVEVDSKMLKRLRIFIHTSKEGKVADVNAKLKLTCNGKYVSFIAKQ